MRLTKFGHACVRLEHDGVRLVIDPGTWTEREAVEGATAVLITHEHPDHYLPDHLLAADAPVLTIEERLQVVSPGEEVDAGLPVRVVGEQHAVIHPDLPRFANSGYLVTAGDTRVFHPGDALTGPGVPVDVLCAPVCAPWLKASEAVDFAREVAAPRNVAIHDKVYSEAGLSIVDGHFRLLLGDDQEYVRLADGADL
jgi:L-ascorbate metabolism protein UlaG (beta-lactamase superfamily)